MAIPAKVAGGGGDNNATKCFKVTFSTALASAPKIEGWDNSSSYPAVDSDGSTTAKEIFTGTTVNTSLPMLAAWSGGAEATGNKPGASWHPATATAGSANPNLLKGQTNYVTCTNTPAAGGNIVFNLSLKIPGDATVPSTTGFAHLVQIRYTYSGLNPALAFFFNEGGDDTTPAWTAFAPGTNGIQFVNASTVSGTYALTLPGPSSTRVAPEIWVTT